MRSLSSISWFSLATTWNQRFVLSFNRVLAPLVTESIIAFAWEPNGSKFAVLHGETPRISVSFYHVKNNGKIELISKWKTSEKYRYKIFCMVIDALNSKLHLFVMFSEKLVRLMLVIDGIGLRSFSEFALFFFRNIWQTAGKHDILESPGAVCGVGWPQKVSVAQVAEHHHIDWKRKRTTASLPEMFGVPVNVDCCNSGRAVQKQRQCRDATSWCILVLCSFHFPFLPHPMKNTFFNRKVHI